MIAAFLMGLALLMALVWMIVDAVELYREWLRGPRSASTKR